MKLYENKFRIEEGIYIIFQYSFALKWYNFKFSTNFYCKENYICLFISNRFSVTTYTKFRPEKNSFENGMSFYRPKRCLIRNLEAIGKVQ